MKNLKTKDVVIRRFRTNDIDKIYKSLDNIPEISGISRSRKQKKHQKIYRISD